MVKSIYYLPGHGGRIGTGLGEGLLSRGFQVAGRETVGEFKKLPFRKQTEVIATDLMSNYWHEDARVICNSFGSYLFLHAQTFMEPYVGKVLLLSPIIGEFSDESSGLGFIPPYAERLGEIAGSGTYPSPMHCEIHVGELDWQSNPKNVLKFAEIIGLPVTVVPQGGHNLGIQYVSTLLDSWL
jgi:hypothetical protein